MGTPAEITTVRLSDDQIIDYTQRVRKSFVGDMLKDGFPTENSDRQVLLSALADMDRVAIQNKKIGSDDAKADADRIAALAIARITQQMGSTIPGERPVIEGSFKEVVGDITLIPAIDVVPGETDIGISDDTYDDFTGRMEKKA